MHRFYLPPEHCLGDQLELSERDAKHANKVLRIKDDERISVLDGQGNDLLCQVTERDRSRVVARVLSRQSQTKLPHALTLVQAVTKGKSMDLIIQKATELGCQRIVPVLSERTVVQCDSEDAESKREKWQTIAVEAMKQCGQARLPKVLAPLSVSAFLQQESASQKTLALLASLQGDATHPRSRVETFREESQSAPSQITVWIGPEGDFTPAEINLIKGGGAQAISLGPLILRSETAALYALSVLNYELSA